MQHVKCVASRFLSRRAGPRVPCQVWQSRPTDAGLKQSSPATLSASQDAACLPFPPLYRCWLQRGVTARWVSPDPNLLRSSPVPQSEVAWVVLTGDVPRQQWVRPTATVGVADAIARRPTVGLLVYPRDLRQVFAGGMPRHQSPFGCCFSSRLVRVVPTHAAVAAVVPSSLMHCSQTLLWRVLP